MPVDFIVNEVHSLYTRPNFSNDWSLCSEGQTKWYECCTKVFVLPLTVLSLHCLFSEEWKQQTTVSTLPPSSPHLARKQVTQGGLLQPPGKATQHHEFSGTHSPTTAVAKAHLSAQTPTGYEAFSTFAPVKYVPSVERKQAPTRKLL
jgi:hypothetical protein